MVRNEKPVDNPHQLGLAQLGPQGKPRENVEVVRLVARENLVVGTGSAKELTTCGTIMRDDQTCGVIR